MGIEMSITKGLEIRATLAEWIDGGGLRWLERDARIERSESGALGIALDETSGCDEAFIVVTESEASQLIGAGLIRDAR